MILKRFNISAIFRTIILPRVGNKIFLLIIPGMYLFLSFGTVISQMSDKEYADSVYNAMDYNNRTVRDLAVRLARKAGGPYNIKQICYIWDYIKTNWSYVNDPSHTEYIAHASESATLLAGDCDDFAVLIAALLKAIGGTPRVNLVSNSSEGHAFTEIYATNDYKVLLQLFDDIRDFYFWKTLFKGKKLTFNYEKDGLGRYWINLDWFSEYVGDSPFYKYTKRIVVNDDGTFFTINQ
jgi:hypothetical protein